MCLTKQARLRWAAGAAVLAMTSAANAQLRSFGEAEGFGALATGARASSTPTIYHVTNLNDAGAGSFRDAVSASNRIVVFDVGGVINLSTTSEVACASNVTIAGQTAPGGGIMIVGNELGFANSNNIICRDLRVRPGDASGSSEDAISLYNADNVMLDHMSLQFAQWNNIDAVTDSKTKYTQARVTVQNSIVADPIGQQFVAHTESTIGSFTWANNLLTSSHNRTPLAKDDTVFKNNVIYNASAAYTTGNTGTPFSHDLVGNYFIAGPATSGNTFYQVGSNQSFYTNGNYLDSNKDGVLNGSITAPTGVITLTSPWSSITNGLPTESAADAYSYVTAHAGASLVRDDLDNLVVNQTETLGSGTTGYTVGTTGPDGGMYHHAYNTGLTNNGLGTISTATRAAGFDSDNDGMPDAWESAHGMNPNLASDALKLNPLGYLMIEQYINELGSSNDSHTSASIAGAWNSTSTWGDGVVPKALDYALIRGNGVASGNVTLASGSATAMKLSIGGNGTAAGESLTVSGTGSLSVYDTIVVGDQNNALLNITGNGNVSAYNIVLGNTVYSPSAVDNLGVLNLTGGTLNVSQIVLGAGTPGSWTRGGTFNWNGGTINAVATLNVNVPISLGAIGGTINTNGYAGTVSSVISDAIASAGTLTKTGAGSLTLTATSPYSGATNVNAGQLIVNGSLSHSAVSVKSGATLSGKGSVYSATIASGGFVSPGAGSGNIATLSVLQNATLIGHLQLDYTGAGTGSIDAFNVAGNLNLTGGTLDLSLLTGGTALDDTAYIFSHYGSLTGTFTSITGLPGGYRVNYAYNLNGSTNYIAIVTPEPATLGLVPLLAALGIRRKRRTR